ncbi:hypothetical protein TNCV_344571 [Trichonephila clavipes]|nr:hypothetical protein TNCV_344571 [Trichonephila clavipes]
MSKKKDLKKGKNAVQARKKLTDVYGEVYENLKGLGLSSKLDAWVPHVLTERNLCRRIDVCDSLLKRHENDQFLKRVITGYEKGHGAKKITGSNHFQSRYSPKKVNGDRYRAMITNFFIPELNNHDVQELWFQQDGATCHTARATIDLLKYTFGDCLISRFGPVNWPPRSCDLTPLD